MSRQLKIPLILLLMLLVGTVNAFAEAKPSSSGFYRNSLGIEFKTGYPQLLFNEISVHYDYRLSPGFSLGPFVSFDIYPNPVELNFVGWSSSYSNAGIRMVYEVGLSINFYPDVFRYSQDRHYVVLGLEPCLKFFRNPDFYGVEDPALDLDIVFAYNENLGRDLNHYLRLETSMSILGFLWNIGLEYGYRWGQGRVKSTNKKERKKIVKIDAVNPHSFSNEAKMNFLSFNMKLPLVASFIRSGWVKNSSFELQLEMYKQSKSQLLRLKNLIRVNGSWQEGLDPSLASNFHLEYGLRWYKRSTIYYGISAGLLYLHEDWMSRYWEPVTDHYALTLGLETGMKYFLGSKKHFFLEPRIAYAISLISFDPFNIGRDILDHSFGGFHLALGYRL